MPSWEQPPKAPWELLKERVEATYPGTSLACDAGWRVTHIQNDEMPEDAFALMVADLKGRFPGAF